MGKSLYELLGLDSNASRKEVFDRYNERSSLTHKNADEWKQISIEMEEFVAIGKDAYDARIDSFNKENEELFNMVNGKKQNNAYNNFKTGVVDEAPPKLKVYDNNKKRKKVNVNKRMSFRKKWIIVAVSVLGVVSIGASVSKACLETVEVPVPESASISDINEFYDTSWYNLAPTDWFTDKDSTYENDKISLTVSNKRVEEMENKAKILAEDFDKEKIKSYYPFEYMVMHGDTKDGLEERFGDDCKISDSLIEDHVITIHTTDKELADKMQNYFKEEQAKKEPVYFEYYVIKQGDLLPNIADEFGVTCQQIMDYNPSIKNIQEIDAGVTIKIPRYEKSKTY